MTNAINANLPKTKLVKVFKDTLTEELHIGKAVLFLYDTKWGREMAYGLGDSEKLNIQVKARPD